MIKRVCSSFLAGLHNMAHRPFPSVDRTLANSAVKNPSVFLFFFRLLFPTHFLATNLRMSIRLIKTAIEAAAGATFDLKDFTKVSVGQCKEIMDRYVDLTMNEIHCRDHLENGARVLHDMQLLLSKKDKLDYLELNRLIQGAGQLEYICGLVKNAKKQAMDGYLRYQREQMAYMTADVPPFQHFPAPPLSDDYLSSHPDSSSTSEPYSPYLQSFHFQCRMLQNKYDVWENECHGVRIERQRKHSK
ncbi:hypothetical protein DM01DRAFT_51954 [Hesseltinella vesiculosa]|uniref:Uncharacterized protein n=1 Tax=Hesseltinella vesiculosa TaxID=101127 RepID=A0A1X2GM78_9FUNG|nr:hypothetical protein DM01DRAFT_51954 [Hesseltinella vesiculosa]